MIREYTRSTNNGMAMIPVLLGLHLVGLVLILMHAPLTVLLGALLELVAAFCWTGLFMVHPNQGRVLQLFGAYRGTERTAGLRWANPFFSKQAVLLRVRNFDSDRLKVNDLQGRPHQGKAFLMPVLPPSS